MKKTIFERMGGTYTEQGNYYLSNLILAVEEEQMPVDAWGQLYTRCLKQNHKIIYKFADKR